jgi:hypothetical protein
MLAFVILFVATLLVPTQAAVGVGEMHQWFVNYQNSGTWNHNASIASTNTVLLVQAAVFSTGVSPFCF